MKKKGKTWRGLWEGGEGKGPHLPQRDVFGGGRSFGFTRPDGSKAHFSLQTSRQVLRRNLSSACRGFIGVLQKVWTSCDRKCPPPAGSRRGLTRSKVLLEPFLPT